MGKRVFCLVLLTIFVAVTFARPELVNAEEDKLVRVGIFDYQTFYGSDDQGMPYGYGYDYLNMLAKYGGFEYEYVYGSWAQCQQWLEQGKIDMLDSAQKLPDREEKFLFSQYSTGTSYGELFVREDNESILYCDFAAMDGMRVGLLEKNSRNQTFLEFAANNGFTVDTVEYPTNAALSDALQNNQVDGIVSSNLRQGKKERSVARFAPAPFYIMINRNKPGLKARVDSALEDIFIDFPNYNSELNIKYYSQRNLLPMLIREELEYVRSVPPVKVIYDGNRPPFCSYDPVTKDIEGINVDLLRLVGEKTGLQFTYLFCEDYGHATQMLAAGEAQLLLGFEPSPQKEQALYINATDTFLSVPLCLVGKVAHMNPNPTFAISQNNSNLISVVSEQFPDATIVILDTVSQCYDEVLAGSADFTIDNVYSATDQVKKQSNSGLMISYTLPTKDYFSFGIWQGADPMLMNVINKGISAISEAEQNSVITHHTVNKLSKQSFRQALREHRIPLYFAGVILFLLLLVIFFLYLLRQKKHKQLLWNTAYIDSLTGIGNLNLFKEEARKRLDKNEHDRYTIYQLDIENLKLYNEIHGFEQGDQVIRNLAQVLTSFCDSAADVCGRIAGDDFALLKCHGQITDDQLWMDYENQLLDQISDHFAGQIKLKFGVYRIENNQEGVAEILEKANYAHSICKASASISRFVYDETLKQRAIEEKKIESRMEQALNKQEFLLYLQPKYRLSDESLSGAEALVRWMSDDDQQMIYPNQFIPLFERNGFITKLDMYMLERVCELIRKWMDEGLTPVTISINFSRLHLWNPQFTQEICQITDRFQIPRSYIEIELTESTMFNNEETMLTVVEKLHEAGFTLSMDDFGTGYSSLGLLKNLPVDVIKIDRSFFSNNRYKTRAKAVLENVMQMAKRLEIHTVAEGVESKEHIDFLHQVGCDMVQGYYYSKPVPASEFCLEQQFQQTPSDPVVVGEIMAHVGDLELGRATMGNEMPVYVHRLYQNAVRKILSDAYGEGEMINVLRCAGRLAGRVFRSFPAIG